MRFIDLLLYEVVSYNVIAPLPSPFLLPWDFFPKSHVDSNNFPLILTVKNTICHCAKIMLRGMEGGWGGLSRFHLYSFPPLVMRVTCTKFDSKIAFRYFLKLWGFKVNLCKTSAQSTRDVTCQDGWRRLFAHTITDWSRSVRQSHNFIPSLIKCNFDKPPPFPYLTPWSIILPLGEGEGE